MSDREFATELTRRGLVILGVVGSRTKPACLTVYLHGSAGQYVGGYARDLVGSMPGVESVTDSHLTPTILLVRVAMGSDTDERS